MIPGLPQGMMDGNEEETGAKLKRMIYITDAMRADELDSDGLIFVSAFVCALWSQLTLRWRLTKLATRSGSTSGHGESPREAAPACERWKSCSRRLE